MEARMKRLLVILIAAFFAVSLGFPAFGLEDDAGNWPRGIQVKGNKVVMYQPQPEELVNDLLRSRAAVSVESVQDEAPVFGAVWLEIRLDRKSGSRHAGVRALAVEEMRFPGLEEKEALELREILEENAESWILQVDMENLQADLELESKRDAAARNISTDPPKILFVDEPAVLVVIDGEPRLKNISNSSLMRVVNTPFTLLFAPHEKRYYLYAAEDTWYTSGNIYDNWTVTRQVPTKVASLAPSMEEFEDNRDRDKQPDRDWPPPEIIISTEPAELISTYGAPEYTPVRGTDLLYIRNTANDVLLNIMDRQYYVLLAGRWYTAKTIQGPWRYIAGDELPGDFARIPENSEIARVLYAVPGTSQAREAVLDAHVPTTAAVDPKSATLNVEYDGKPEFDPIRGTDLYYAVNTSIPVIWAGRYYYACDAGVWFVAPSPKGSWQVATSIPDEIYLIPPDSPVYNVTYVRVYSGGPDVVYVGYTPGYSHTYVYNGTIVYGTGYYWPGWYGHYYYPRPRTWGFQAHWDPWYGWGYGVGYSTGSFHFSLGSGGGWYRGSWWDPYWRDDPYYYYDGYRDRPYYGHRSWHGRDRYYGHRNLYWSKRNKTRVIGIPEKPGSRPGKSKGITRRDRWNREDRRDRPTPPPRRVYPEHQGGPSERWLQYEDKRPVKQVPPRKIKPSRDTGRRDLQRPLPDHPVGPSQDWLQSEGKQPARPKSPPPHTVVPKRPQPPPQQYDRNWGTQQVDPAPPPQQNSPPPHSVVPKRPPPSQQNYNQGGPEPGRQRDFHGTVGPRDGGSRPPADRWGGRNR